MRGSGAAVLLLALTAGCAVKRTDPAPGPAPAAAPPAAAAPVDDAPAAVAEPPPVDGGAAPAPVPAAWPPPDGVTRIDVVGTLTVRTVCHKRACRRGDPSCPCQMRVDIAVDAGPYAGRGFDVDGHGCRPHGATPACPYVHGARIKLAGVLLSCQGGSCRVIVPPHAGATLAGTVSELRASYCGGARPPPGVQLVRQRPWAEQVLAVVLGREYDGGTPVAYAATDATGRFAIALPPGTWCLLEAARTVPPAPGAAVSPHVDPACMAAQRRRCDAVVDVPQTTPLAIQLSRGCFPPCYRGPKPP